MIIHLNLKVETIAKELARDPEEAAYVLLNLMERTNRDFGEEIADLLSTFESQKLAQYLRRLADQIHAPVN